jgi:hypothetical protein
VLLSEQQETCPDVTGAPETRVAALHQPSIRTAAASIGGSDTL